MVSVPLVMLRVPPLVTAAAWAVEPIVVTLTSVAVIDEFAPVANKPLDEAPDVVTVAPAVSVTRPALSAWTPAAALPLVLIVVPSAAMELPVPVACSAIAEPAPVLTLPPCSTIAAGGCCLSATAIATRRNGYRHAGRRECAAGAARLQSDFAAACHLALRRFPRST